MAKAPREARDHTRSGLAWFFRGHDMRGAVKSQSILWEEKSSAVYIGRFTRVYVYTLAML